MSKSDLDMDAQGKMLCLTDGRGSQSEPRQRRHCASGNACNGGWACPDVDS